MPVMALAQIRGGPSGPSPSLLDAENDQNVPLARRFLLVLSCG